jgi:uncharacterized membrane protein YraQ (UPF0718 family)
MPYTLILERFQTFVTIFLGIFIEAVPFLLAGSVVSGLIEVYLKRETLFRLIPRQPVVAALMGASMGLLFPVCECGVVPVTRRLYQKGLPVSVGIAFLLAAPVINPIVILSTYAAFGWGPILWGRIVFTFVIAFAIGLIFQLATPKEVFPPATLQNYLAPAELEPRPVGTVRERLPLALRTAGDDFLDMARYLVIGCLLAAAMQTFIPQSVLLAVGANPVASVLVMLILAFVLSVCSTVDAFVALAFVGTFTPASILVFLVFGPMVDIKSTTMFLGVFQRRTVVYLVLLPMAMALLLGVYLNLNAGAMR